MLEPIDPFWNKVVLEISAKLMPNGYAVTTKNSDSYKTLREHWFKTGVVKVWGGASDNTIYGYREVNWAFRAWHDYCHLVGNHDFSPMGEASVLSFQKSHVRGHCSNYSDEVIDRLCLYLDIEIQGQQEHYTKYGFFPQDQRKFFIQELNKRLTKVDQYA